MEQTSSETGKWIREVKCTGKQENKDIRLESLQGHRRVIKELYDHSGDADNLPQTGCWSWSLSAGY